jgi:lipopolysaccharide export system protein LptA
MTPVPRRRPERPRATLALLALLVCMPAHALKSDRDKPMDVSSDSLQASTNDGISTLNGNVRMTQGTLKVGADRAVVHQNDKHEIARVELFGAPAALAEELDEGGLLDARARSMDYDLKTQLVVMTGEVVVKQPRGELRGEKVTYDLSTGKLTGSGEGTAGRVQLHIAPPPPKAKDAEAKPTTEAKSG